MAVELSMPFRSLKVDAVSFCTSVNSVLRDILNTDIDFELSMMNYEKNKILSGDMNFSEEELAVKIVSPLLRDDAILFRTGVNDYDYGMAKKGDLEICVSATNIHGLGHAFMSAIAICFARLTNHYIEDSSNRWVDEIWSDVEDFYVKMKLSGDSKFTELDAITTAFSKKLYNGGRLG